MGKLQYEYETYQIRGAVFEVYREMGSGFLESVYQECLVKELSQCGIPFVSQPELVLPYKGQRLLHTYRPDLVCLTRLL